MKSIEFVGPSSIGKSTFLNKYSKLSSVRSQWRTFHAALAQISTYENREINIWDRVLNKLNIRDLPNISNGINTEDLFKKYDDELEPLSEIFLKTIDQTPLDSWQKICWINYYFYNIIGRALLIYEKCDHDQVILFDEGIAHNGRFHYASSELLKNHRTIRDSNIFPSGIVHFDLDDANFEKRIIKRFRKKGDNRLYKFCKFIPTDKINDHIKREREDNFKKIETFKKLNIPVLEIKAQLTEHNFQKLDNFVSTIYSTNKFNRESNKENLKAS